MKIYSEETSPAGKKRILLAVEVEEIELLRGILEKASLVFPLGEKWKPDGQRLANMVRVFKECLNSIKS